MRSPLYPEPLEKGDTIAIIAPAGQLQNKSLFLEGVEILQGMGFKVHFPRDLWPGSEYLADSDANRALEFNKMIADKNIKALISMRGGYGCLRMLDKVDLSLVKRNPKILVGFSDITILQNFLYAKTGLVSLHGPVVTSLSVSSKDTLFHLFHCLTDIRTQRIESKQVEVLRSGPDIASPIIGGNLASLVTLLGTAYDYPWDKKIVFLEDINEPAYKIDRMFTQLQLAGKLDNISGLILGDFSISTEMNGTDKLRHQESIWNRVLELCSNREIPVWGNFPAGHCSCNLTFPIGAVVEMKRSTTQLHFH